MGCVLLLVRRWRLPFGALTLIFSLNAALLCALDDRSGFIVVAAGAGLVADGLLAWWSPGPARPRAVRAFAAAVPLVLYLLYFLALRGMGEIAWSLPLWTGAIVEAAATGWLVSFLIFTPPAPAPAPPN